MGKYRIGLDMGPTNTKIGLFDDDMNCIDSMQALTDQDADQGWMLGFFERLLRKMLKAHDLTVNDLSGVGMALASNIDYAGGVVLDTDYMMSFSNAPVRDLLAERLGVQVCLDNDCNAAALAEHTLGAGVGHDDMIYATLATGIGGGLILNGKLYRGMHGMAGEIGHMLVSDSTGYPCSCGVTGCAQSIASGAQMAKYAIDRIKEGADSLILNYAGTLSNVDMVAVGRAFERNDPLAVETVARGAEYLARMFSSLNHIFDINIFVYGGGMVKLGNPFIDRIIAAYRRLSINDPRFPTRFIPSRFGDEASMVGAALLVGLNG